jgi:hypothetical protein
MQQKGTFSAFLCKNKYRNSIKGNSVIEREITFCFNFGQLIASLLLFFLIIIILFIHL